MVSDWVRNFESDEVPLRRIIHFIGSEKQGTDLTLAHRVIMTNIPWVIIGESSTESHELEIINNETVLLASLNQYAFVEIEIVTGGKVKSIEIELTNQNAAHQKSNQKQECKSWWIGIFQRYVTLRILEKQKKNACFGESLGCVSKIITP